MDRHPHGKAIVVDADAALARFAASLEADPPLSASDLRDPVEYRGYRELLEAWARLDGVRSRMIGRSVAGQPLWMCEVGNPEARKVSVVLAGIHPIEWIGVETALALARLHSERPCGDRRVCFVPLVNVDGFRRVEANLRGHKRRWVRSNDNRVDLNRNWPTHFRRHKGLIAGHNSSGPAPCSEPEIQAVVSTLDELSERHDIDVALSLHSIGKMILFPYGGKWRAPADRRKHVRAARALKARLGAYTIRQCARWVPGAFAHGMEIDHLHDAYGATALLVECTRGELSLRSPAALLDPFRIFNPRHGIAEGRALAAALDPFVRGDL